jgi:deoxyadenosine/deoxycytidine kinase
MKYSFITIEGNIGAGKTTLANLLSKHFNARLILEEFAENPFLPKFYENQEQYAFPQIGKHTSELQSLREIA